MRPIISSMLLAAVLASGETLLAASDPIVYVSLGDTTIGQPAIKAFTDVHVAIPLDNPADFAGTVASVNGDVITISGTPGFGANEYATAGSPFVAKFEGGARSGLNCLVYSNTSNTLTIGIPAGDNLNGVLAGDPITIRPAWTVKRLMGTNVPVGTQIFARSGKVPGFNLSPDVGYEFNGISWDETFTLEQADAAVLYTGEGLVIRNPTSTPIASLVVSGEAPTSASRVVLSKLAAGLPQDNWISYVSPVDEPIGSSSLPAIASVGDQILAFDNSQPGMNKSSTMVLEFNGVYWEDSFTFFDVSTLFMLNGSQTYVYRRSFSSPVGDKIWSDLPTYVENL